jgi:hypothetical protein
VLGERQQVRLSWDSHEMIDHGARRIEMFVNASGIPISLGRDDFGYRFCGPGLGEIGFLSSARPYSAP